LELHHIFPKVLLYKNNYPRSEVNAIANFTFLTKETNLRIMDGAPESYLAEIAERDPSLLESHWVPLDPALWKPENYPDFLVARRGQLAGAANACLGSLLAGSAPEAVVGEVKAAAAGEAVVGGVADEEEGEELEACNLWIVRKGLPEGEVGYEITDRDTGEPLAVLDLAWPEGLQEGLSEPVALLIDEGPEVEEVANRAGF
ncbi:MAG: hypothetical protein ACRD1Z_18690, partial [Vicinamibacteria bacterium]